MSSYDVVLFFHIAVVLLAFLLAGALHGSEYLSAGATTVGELRRMTRPQKLGPLFAPIVIALLGLGMELVHLSKDDGDGFKLSNGFVVTGIVAVGLLLLDGPVVMGRHFAKLDKALASTADGPVPPDLRALACDPLSWAVGHANTLGVVGVVLNMATKPSLGICILDIAVGAVAGAVLGATLARRAVATRTAQDAAPATSAA
jgi:hypothetical protein